MQIANRKVGNKIVTVAFLLLMFTLMTSELAFSQSKTIVVKGHVKFDDPKFKMEVYRMEGPEKIVVAEFNIDANNNFRQELTVDKPGLWHIDCKKWESISFWAEDENVEINFRGKDTAKMVIKNPPFHMINGGPKNEVINQFNFLAYRDYQSMIAVSQIAYRAKFASEEERQAATNSLYDANRADLNARVKFLAELYSDRTSVIALLGYLDYTKDKELIDKISAKIYSAHPNYAPLKKFIKEKEQAIENAKKMATGSLAPDFEYPAQDGKLFGPKSFRGKALLIDFWASWCGPCVAEIPNVKKVYDQYKDKGLEVMSVSVDKGTDEWLKAIKSTGMTWTQVLAPKAGKDIMNLYQFSGIPFIVLLDKDGKIVGKNIRGTALENAVKEMLDK